MARAKKSKGAAADRPGLDDPKAPLDGSELLAAARPVLEQLRVDLAERAEDARVERALRERYESDKAAKLTGDSFAEWREGLLAQVAASWFLSCVFVRTLEDRGLLGQARLAGPGATDSQTLFFELAPSLTERDYLLFVFRELSELPAAGVLFDRQHALVWQLSPSAEAAKELLRLFRKPSADAPAFRFGQASTRFLGDLYQDLYEDVRKRYALLQTPDFIEAFILDRTLEPAIDRFGLDDTTLIDPTCGSGHFLLGAFDRLFEHRLRTQPGIDVGQAAHKAPDAVYGADINPYAVAIARVRLTLSFLAKAGIRRLKDAPALPLHLVVADSLLYNPQHVHQAFEHQDGQLVGAWRSSNAFLLEDEGAMRNVLHREYAAAVGNPPYGNASDRALKKIYRSLYASASGKFTLGAPFIEAFIGLCREHGFVGAINSLAFANKLYGRPLIEEVLIRFDVTHVLSTAGVYFPPPGFSVVTGVLFVRNRKPGSHLQLLRQVSPDPGQYINPADGVVWQSIVRHADDNDYEDAHVQVKRASRVEIASYPWKLLANAADGLATRLEEAETSPLVSLCTRAGIGFAAISAADELFQVSSLHWIVSLAPDWFRVHLTGEAVRDYVIDVAERVFWPYDEKLGLRILPFGTAIQRWLWPHRRRLGARATFAGGTYDTDPKRTWYQWHQVAESRTLASRRVVFPELLTEMHFVRESGRVSISQSLMCFVPREDLCDDALCALIAFLNSSTAAAWIKSRCAPLGTARGDVSREKGKSERFRVPANMASKVPIPFAVVAEGTLRNRLAFLYRQLERNGEDRGELRTTLLSELSNDRAPRLVERWKEQEQDLIERSVVLQEEIDWNVYAEVLGIPMPEVALSDMIGARAPADQRPAFCKNPEVGGSAHVSDVWKERRALVLTDPLISAVEQERCKRSWLGPRGVFGLNRRTNDEMAESFKDEVQLLHIINLFAKTAEMEPLRLSVLQRTSSSEEVTAMDFRAMVDTWAVPYLAALTYSISGLAKYSNGQNASDLELIPSSAAKVPFSEFEETDFLDKTYWPLRRAWDVPGEHFVSYPGCESDEDSEPIYGWAGWHHLQRAQALASLYQKRKTDEGWTVDRLTPMLAGLFELLPWIRQWHNEPDAEFGGLKMGDYFAQFLDGECQTLGLTHSDLEAWRPAKKTAASRSKVVTPKTTATATNDGGGAAKPRKTRRKKLAANGSAGEGDG